MSVKRIGGKIEPINRCNRSRIYSKKEKKLDTNLHVISDLTERSNLIHKKTEEHTLIHLSKNVRISRSVKYILAFICCVTRTYLSGSHVIVTHTHVHVHTELVIPAIRAFEKFLTNIYTKRYTRVVTRIFDYYTYCKYIAYMYMRVETQYIYIKYKKYIYICIYVHVKNLFRCLIEIFVDKVARMIR